MTDFVRFALPDGSDVFFEAAESDLVRLHGGEPEVMDGGGLRGRLGAVAAAAEQVSSELRSRLQPDEVSVTFGVKVSGEVSWWFFAKNQAEANISVTLTWAAPRPAE